MCRQFFLASVFVYRATAQSAIPLIYIYTRSWLKSNEKLGWCFAFMHFVFLYFEAFYDYFLLLVYLIFAFLWMSDLKYWNLGSVIQMFCPAVGVIQCCDAEDATEAQETEFFPLHPHQSSSSHSSPHPLSPAFCPSLELNSLKTLSSIHCSDF